MNKNKLFVYIIIIFSLLCLNPALATAHKSPLKSELHFIALSDIHLDPFQGCHFAKICHTVNKLTKAPVKQWYKILSNNKQQQNSHLLLGMDTNQYLFDKTLMQLKKQAQRQKPDFIVITGDFIAHGIKQNYQRYFNTHKGYKDFIRKFFQYIHAQLKSAAPTTPLYFVMGNNDGYLGDYVSNAGGQFFKDLKQDWPGLIQKSEHKSDLLDRSANYAITTPNRNWRLLMLNTHIFYKKTTGKNKNIYANESILWLAKQLNIAEQKKQNVLMFYHIPYGIQPSKRFLAPDIAALWTPYINHEFLALVTHHKKIIKGMFHGHVHRNAFMLLHKNRTVPLPQQLISAISPIFGNASTFSVFKFENDKLSMKKIKV